MTDLFLFNDSFQRISHEFGERDRTCRCFFLHVLSLQGRQVGHADGEGYDSVRAHCGSGNQGRTTTQPMVLKDGCSSSWPRRLPSMGEACKAPLRFFKVATEGESSGGRIWNIGGRSMHRCGSLPAPLSCARAGVRLQPAFGTDRSLGRSACLAASQRSKQVCVRRGRSSGCLPQSPTAVSLKPDTWS